MSNEGDIYLLRALEHENVLRACLYRITRNTSDVDELLQETYTRVLTAGARERPLPQSMRAFALTIARNVALDWLRHRRVVPIEPLADLAEWDVMDEGAQVDEIVNTHQELMLLRDAIGQLPARCREVFTLRRVYGLAQKQVAAELKISEHTVERHMTRALQQLAKILLNAPIATPPSALLDRLTRRGRGHEDGE